MPESDPVVPNNEIAPLTWEVVTELGDLLIKNHPVEELYIISVIDEARQKFPQNEAYAIHAAFGELLGLEWELDSSEF